MAAPFVHLEVVGPRASLDRWLAVLQDHGGCHLADALTGLEGEAGVARPQATPAEMRGAVLRSEAAHLLHGIERFLPSSAPGEVAADRPAWSVGPGGQDEVDVEVLRDEARRVGERIRDGLEAARSAEHVVDACDEESAALDALTAAGAEKAEGRLYVLSRARARRLLRILRSRGARAAAADTAREAIVAAVGDTSGDAVEAALAAARARPFALADDLVGLGLREARTALDARREPARQRLEDSLVELRRRLAGDGGRARALLDALEDAETRGRSWSRLASSRHVVAARVFVRPEDVDGLVRGLGHTFGTGEVVVRELDPAPADMPALPRAVAGLPFAALDGLRPSRFGEVATASLLALFVPLAAAVVLADLAGGLALLLVGALIGLGAVLGSPRRDTALLAQAAGLVALVFGILEGRAFGAAGASWFGSEWGLLGSPDPLLGYDPIRSLVMLVGGAALLLGVWGLICALVALQGARPGRARLALVGALALFTVTGSAGLAFPHDSVLRWLWLLAPASALGVLLLAGLRQGVVRLLLDLVGVVRCLAVALMALFLFYAGFTVLGQPLALQTALAPALLVLGALTMVVDSAYVAMGVPYDLSLGARTLGQPFSPLTRRVVRGRARTGEEMR